MTPLGELHQRKRKRDANQTATRISTLAVQEGRENPEDDVQSQDPALSRSPAESFADVAETTRESLRTTPQRRCWLCGLPGADTSYVYPDADEALFKQWKALGVIQAHSIHSFDNLILFCKTCYRGYRRRVPAWTFLPTDIDTLITKEEAFQRQRAAAAADNCALLRPPYTALPCLTYTRYLVRDENPPHLAPIAVPQKRWMGDPALAIIQSASILGAPRLPPEVAAVLPKLNRLLELYRAEPPVMGRPMADAGHAPGSGGDGGTYGAGEKWPQYNDKDIDEDDIDELASDQTPNPLSGPKASPPTHHTKRFRAQPAVPPLHMPHSPRSSKLSTGPQLRRTRRRHITAPLVDEGVSEDL